VRSSRNRPRATPASRLEIRRLLLAQPLVPIAGQERLVEALQRHATRVFGEPVGAGGVPLYTDARHYSAAGIPVVLYGAGPAHHRGLERQAS
jgi:acetylornithine deacetylase/succinyl-diaminopimelate desuccinylase-like protein